MQLDHPTLYIHFFYHTDLVVFWSEPVLAVQFCGEGSCTGEFYHHPQQDGLSCPC